MCVSARNCKRAATAGASCILIAEQNLIYGVVITEWRRENMVGPFRPKQNHKAIGERSEAIIITNYSEGGGDRTLGQSIKSRLLCH